MYPQAVEAGIPASEYWLMTFDELMVQIQANKVRKENELKEKAMFDYSQQKLAVYAFNDPKKFPKFEEAYPFLQDIENLVNKGITEYNDQEILMHHDQDILMKNAKAIEETRKRKMIEER
ncbi:prophage protein [Enterococcus faecalis AZ19]|uniref:hypothetical protein n=1 Tax=Enterococcus faecalis TaxID=1351 RepID=UPI000459DCF2|nr:hypothetical protein [Enterococcus faecalis]KAJ76043.1 prophage protein [Enterococcus faecalis AZ19]